ncbi:MAG: class I SAM-dependent methyltransferase [Vicinamibacterales bacterium]
MTIPISALDSDHNGQQRAYFEGAVKRTMIPIDSPYLQRHVDALLQFGNITSADRILEVGCGMGRYTLLLARRGIQIEGLDLSPVLLARLRAYAAGSFDGPLYEADIAHPPSELIGRFDGVIALFALHHMRDLTAIFTSMFRLVKPGGRVVFLEPNPYNPLYYLQMLVTPGMGWKGDGGIIRMRRRVISEALSHAGFADPEMVRFGFLPPFAVNRPAGRRVEAVLERIPLWQWMLPFQLIRAHRP